ncbi:hypothetical protein M0C34_04125 [Agarivorans sp. TSD2052]|uniref:hypothetical protein n=1 Tax=Agarivorans sp. TSD2052 TaxID=2937286 RepID=UPI00200EA5BB|nr:hypothetical protein [Agarivorans sp. TSD2052]UPW19475.1 hypothetical protein M0C34_04125 [Agarivorans sp. TSD2052]
MKGYLCIPIIGFFVLIAVVAGIFHILTDDELHPEAKSWIEHYSRPVDLKGNAFIELIALSSAGECSRKQAINSYQSKLHEINTVPPSDFQELQYPNVNGLPNVFDETSFCYFDKENCLLKTARNRIELEAHTLQFESVIHRYLSISKLSNFTPINTFATKPIMDSLASLQRLALLEVYFYILDNNLELAAQQLSQLIVIDRKLLINSPDLAFHALAIVNYESFYQPLIIELKRKGFSNWDLLAPAFVPLSIEEISFNSVWQSEFSNFAKNIESIGKRVRSNLWNVFTVKLKFKENMTLNRAFKFWHQMMIPEEVEKGGLIEIVKLHETSLDEQLEEVRWASDKRFWFGLNNYRNIIGSIVEMTARPRFLSFYPEKLKFDLRILLLDLLINQDAGFIAEAINLEEYNNPYTGEAPTLSETDVCYTLEEDKVCVPLY